MEKDPPCYQWENSRTFYGHGFNSFLYVDPRPGNQKTSPVIWPIQGPRGIRGGIFLEITKLCTAGWWFQPSWKIIISQWEGWHPIYYGKNMFETVWTTSQTVTWGLLFRDFLLWICGRTFCGVRNRVRFDNWVGLRDWLLKKNMFPYMIFPYVSEFPEHVTSVQFCDLRFGLSLVWIQMIQ